MVDVSIDPKLLGLLSDTRAGKLLVKGTPFLCVKFSEPYARMVYETIRIHELDKGTWTDIDEEEYQAFLATQR